MSDKNEAKSAKPNKFLMSVNLEVQSFATETGLDLTYRQTKRKPHRTITNILVLHFVAVPDAEIIDGDRLVDASKLVQIKHTRIVFDQRAQVEDKTEVTWKAESPSVYAADHSLEARDGDGTIIEKRHAQTVKRGFARDFDPAAVQAAILLGDDKYTVEFLNKYLPVEFGLEE